MKQEPRDNADEPFPDGSRALPPASAKVGIGDSSGEVPVDKNLDSFDYYEIHLALGGSESSCGPEHYVV